MKDFFDRKNEQQTLNHAILNINSQKSVMIWIEGEPGVGKSYLLKHSLRKITCPIFQYLGCKKVYKCDLQDMEQEFSYISNIITTLQNNNPALFQKELINYFNRNNCINIIEAFASVIPSIPVLKWSQEIFDKFNNRAERTREFILNKTLKSTLILCFSEIILSLLEKLHPEKSIVFCIDDIIWMDSASLETLETLLSILRIKNSYSISISFFVTSRNLDVLESNEVKNYHKIETDIFVEFFSYRYLLLIHNFDLKTVKEVIAERQRPDLYKHIESIHLITEGNPQELMQTLKFNDIEIIQRINGSSQVNSSIKQDKNYFTRELLESLPQKNEYTIALLCISSMVDKYLKPDILFSLCRSYICQNYHSIFIFSKYEEAINLLKSNDLIYEDDYIYIKHDTIKTTVNDYLKESGEFENYGMLISNFFIHNDMSKDSNYIARVNIALNILKIINPKQGLNEFINLVNDNYQFFTPDNARIAAICFCRNFDCINDYLINDFIIPQILQNLVLNAQYDLAFEVCEMIFKKKVYLSNKSEIIFLSNYAKVLIDLGLIRNETKLGNTAISIVDTLISRSITDDDKLLGYLLKMSAHEHVSEYDDIKYAYNEAKFIVNQKNTLNNLSLCTFYRNKGLIQFHSKLEYDYLLACDYANKISDENTRNIMLGTCYNNLGLSYFHNEKIELALDYFNKALLHLKQAGYDLIRVMNNISVCYFLLGDFESSYTYVSTAMTMPSKGVFESLSVNINMSLNLYKLGFYDEAKTRLNSIVEEYKEGKIQTDTAAYSAAMVNMGYIKLKEDKYIEAYDLFKTSKCHTYKNANDIEQQKRNELCNYCLYKEGILPNTENSSIDFHEKELNLFHRPYSLILLAFYVI